MGPVRARVLLAGCQCWPIATPAEISDLLYMLD
jgi:hypothetical protein